MKKNVKYCMLNVVFREFWLASKFSSNWRRVVEGPSSYFVDQTLRGDHFRSSNGQIDVSN